LEAGGLAGFRARGLGCRVWAVELRVVKDYRFSDITLRVLG